MISIMIICNRSNIRLRTRRFRIIKIPNFVLAARGEHSRTMSFVVNNFFTELDRIFKPR